jgi:hypothetical protein
MGALLLFDLATRASDLTDHYTDAGVLPRAAVRATYGRFGPLSLHMLSGAAAFQAALFALAAVAASLLLVGWHTRLATAASWLLLASLHGRNTAILDGGDHLACLLLLWGSFVPLGARCSFDALRRGPPSPDAVTSLGTVGLMAQILAPYWCSAIFKARFPDWIDGTALQHILQQADTVTRFGLTLVPHPHLLRALNYAVLGLEVAGPLLLLSPVAPGPVRTAAVLAFVGLHVGILLSIKLVMFPFCASLSTLVFLPAWFWDRVAASRPGRLLAAIAERHRSVRPPSRGPGSSSVAGRSLEVVAGVLLVYVGWINVGRLSPALRMPHELASIAVRLRIDQYWALYADDREARGWLVIPGKLRDGTFVDLARGDVPVVWDKPAVASEMYKSRRWWGYMWGVLYDNTLPAPLAAYYCRSWNAVHVAPRQLDALEVVWMREQALPSGGLREPTAVSRWKEVCPR